ncbi:MAG: N-acetylmuramoyl-L-alanine amidase [Oscillospiraceae bacterium]
MVTVSICVLNGGKSLNVIENCDDFTPTKIVIDAGHGGYDGGAVAPDGSLEKDINLDIALKFKDLLIASGFDVIMTRDDDVGLDDKNAATVRNKKVTDMNNRLKVLKDNPDAIFISIHQNKFPNSNIKGAQVFYNKKSEESEKLAASTQQQLIKIVDNENSRKHKSSGAEYFLLEYSSNVGIIVECGFVSNEDELIKIKDEEYQKKIAIALLSAIYSYLSLEQ